MSSPYERAPGAWQPQQPLPQDPYAPYAAPPVPPRPAGRAKPAAKKKGSPLAGCITLVVIAGIIVLVISLVTSGPSASWRASVQDYNVINPADLAVTVRVVNTGKVAGTPTCTVQASDPSDAYNGTDVATLQGSIQPGAFSVYVDNVTITGHGAQFVTQVSVSCS